MDIKIARRLRDIGVWIPGSKAHIEFAFDFWAPLFGWRNPANCPKVKQRRLQAVQLHICNATWCPRVPCYLL